MNAKQRTTQEDQDRLLNLLQEKFAADNADEVKRWNKALSDEYGYTAVSLRPRLDMTPARFGAALRALLARKLIRVSQVRACQHSYRFGGGGASNFTPQHATTYYDEESYRAVVPTTKPVRTVRCTCYDGHVPAPPKMIAGRAVPVRSNKDVPCPKCSGVGYVHALGEVEFPLGKSATARVSGA